LAVMGLCGQVNLKLQRFWWAAFFKRAWLILCWLWHFACAFSYMVIILISHAGHPYLHKTKIPVKLVKFLQNIDTNPYRSRQMNIEYYNI
jgi:hypothetical protein